MGFDLDRIREILGAEDRLAQLRQEARTNISKKRRQDIVREAIVINRHVQSQVLEKLAVLRGFLAELEAKAAQMHAVAKQWGVEMEAELDGIDESGALTRTGAASR